MADDSLWSRLRHAQGTLTKVARRNVHKENYFGTSLRGTSTEEEKLAAAFELGVGWLFRAEPEAVSYTHLRAHETLMNL
eukprot:7385105-Prymnesium_polylepis.1